MSEPPDLTMERLREIIVLQNTPDYVLGPQDEADVIRIKKEEAAARERGET